MSSHAQVESNGIVAATLQKMLIQTDRDRILLFPAFLSGLDLDMKLHASGYGAKPPAVVRVVVKGGNVQLIDVTPDSRRSDVVVLRLQDVNML